MRTIGDDLAERIQVERESGGPFRDMRDLARRMATAGKPLTTANLEALATADAFACFPAEAVAADAAAAGAAGADAAAAGAAGADAAAAGAAAAAADAANANAIGNGKDAVDAAMAAAGRPLSRREALWAAGAAAQERADRLPGTTMGVRAPVLPGMDQVESMVADVWSTGLSPDTHPVQFVRGYLTSLGAHPIDELPTVENGTRVLVGGIVTHRQRPATASGITFLNLEDETGMLNVVCSPGLWQRHRRVARTASAMVIRGRLERVEGVVNLVADLLAALSMPVRSASRDFR